MLDDSFRKKRAHSRKLRDLWVVRLFSSRSKMKVVCLLLLFTVSCVLATPSCPNFYPSYELVQTSYCYGSGLNCPTGFGQQLIASQSYYDYISKQAGAEDTYDLNAPENVYSTDQTFIFMNESNIVTRIAYLTPGATEVKCFSTSLKGSFPSYENTAYVLVNTTTFGREKANLWYNKGPVKAADRYLYTSVEDPTTILGMQTAAEIAYFSFYRQSNLNGTNVWKQPNVSCPVANDLQHLSPQHRDLLLLKLLRFGIWVDQMMEFL